MRLILKNAQKAIATGTNLPTKLRGKTSSEVKRLGDRRDSNPRKRFR